MGFFFEIYINLSILVLFPYFCTSLEFEDGTRL